MGNRGKQFEQLIKEAFEKVPGVSIDRIPDQTMGYRGACNISDFIVYKEPYEYYIECKSTKGACLPFANITDNQWKGLLEKSEIPGVYAGIICWWIDKDVTLFLPIQTLSILAQVGMKSIRYDFPNCPEIVKLQGKKKRVFFDYNMEQFFKEVAK